MARRYRARRPWQRRASRYDDRVPGPEDQTQRVRAENQRAERPGGAFVLYWMIATRRTRHNFALDRAIAWAQELEKPLLVLEPLRAGYPHASDRLHRFVIEGMRENADRFAKSPVRYFPYVEPKAGAGKGLLAALAEHAAVVVTDYWPCFFLPRMVRAAAGAVPVRLESVDSCGLLPLSVTAKAFARAVDFRRELQKRLPAHFSQRPVADPLRGLRLPTLGALPKAASDRWPAAPLDALLDGGIAALPIDHDVAPVATRGGEGAAQAALKHFLEHGLPRYGAESNHPDAAATSGLSPYLHFGHLSAHDVFWSLAAQEQWTPDVAASRAAGQRQKWWNMSETAESFVDQLITWRELGHVFNHHQPRYDHYDTLPNWAKATLAEHAKDRRPELYDDETLEAAATGDPIWNAAQTELLREGRIHNYLRMLWGKKILQWSASPEQALERMIRLNDRYALDGRDPNSYSGIFWCLGRFDRAWGPERPIFGKVRYMTSDSTQKKLRLRAYLARYGENTAQAELFAGERSG